MARLWLDSVIFKVFFQSELFYYSIETPANSMVRYVEP